MSHPSGEIPQGDPRVAKMLEFFQRGIALQGVNNFLVVGGASNQDRADFSEPTLIAIFPKPGWIKGIAVISMKPGEQAMTRYSEIVAMQLPDRLRRLGMLDILGADEQARQDGTPSVMLAFGKTEKEHKTVAALFVLPGISPAAALADLQRHAQERIDDMSEPK